jgi:hypothetical protein
MYQPFSANVAEQPFTPVTVASQDYFERLVLMPQRFSSPVWLGILGTNAPT